LSRSKDPLSQSEHKPKKKSYLKKPRERKKGGNFIKNRITSIIGAEDALAIMMLREFNEMDM
jgi:hypothetical protein